MELLIQIIFAIVITIGFFKTLQFSVDSVADKVTKEFKIFSLSFYKLNDSQRAEVHEYFGDFISRLSAREVLLFEQKTAKFIKMKTFLGRQGISEVSDFQKLMIAACAVQITFGFPDIFLKHFKTIILYPSDYLSSVTNDYHQGEVNMRGAIVLSWDNFASDYSDSTDGKNLGIHEMAHALVFENFIGNKEYNFLSEPSLKKLTILKRDFEQKPEHDVHQFLRPSAFLNDQEFFAVTSESFFERPEELSLCSADLYQAKAEVLKQDPLT